MSLLASLLRDFDKDDRDYLLGVIAANVAADREAALAGGAPRRQVDVGTRFRARRSALGLTSQAGSAAADRPVTSRAVGPRDGGVSAGLDVPGQDRSHRSTALRV